MTSAISAAISSTVWVAVLRAAYASALGRDFRHDVALPWKHHVFAEALAPVTAAMSEPDRTHLLRVIQALANSHALRIFKDDLDLSAEAAGETVAWLIRTLARLGEDGGRPPHRTRAGGGNLR